MKRSSGPRNTADLSESIHRQLNMYALAATAAGVGTLALPQPSEAKIVYTAAHVKIQPQQKYCFDIDRDQRLEVCLTRRGHYYNTYVLAFVEGSQQGNGIAASRPGRAWELAILPGAKIGPARHFTNSSYDLMADGNSSKGASHVTWGGPWANGGKGVKNRYLGIKFKGGDGYSHYGWARATVTIDNPKINQISSVLLTGYAYETIPNKTHHCWRNQGHRQHSRRAGCSSHHPEPRTRHARRAGIGSAGTLDLAAGVAGKRATIDRQPEPLHPCAVRSASCVPDRPLRVWK